MSSPGMGGVYPERALPHLVEAIAPAPVPVGSCRVVGGIWERTDRGADASTAVSFERGIRVPCARSKGVGALGHRIDAHATV
jgi:hypothetical protein